MRRHRKKPAAALAIVVLLLAGTALVDASAGPIAGDGFFDQARAWFVSLQKPELATPAGWPRPVYDGARNPVTRAGFALGRKLFYDPQLSRDGSVSCGSCHQQFAAFAHYDHKLSHGIGGVNGTRNAPGLFNLAWQRDLMWDGAVTHLEMQPLAPLTNTLEMGETLDHVLAKLRADARYPALFERAFDSPGIDSQRFLRALTQFMATMISAGSRYDRHVRDGEVFSAAEIRGLDRFREHCGGCHQEPLFTDQQYRSNGLAGEDIGRERISGRVDDRARFRVPSLRNVALTAPYMHDGRFDTLDQVLRHYRGDLQATVDPQLRKAAALSDADASDILAFLDTLTDERFVHDPRFAERAAR